MYEVKVSSYNTIGRMSETSVEALKTQEQRGCASHVLGEKKKPYLKYTYIVMLRLYCLVINALHIFRFFNVTLI